MAKLKDKPHRWINTGWVEIDGLYSRVMWNTLAKRADGVTYWPEPAGEYAQAKLDMPDTDHATLARWDKEEALLNAQIDAANPTIRVLVERGDSGNGNDTTPVMVADLVPEGDRLILVAAYREGSIKKLMAGTGVSAPWEAG